MMKLRLLLSALSMFAIVAPTPASAQDQSSPQDTMFEAEWKRGYHGLAMLCQSNGLELVDNHDDLQRIEPRRTILIVLGDVEYYAAYIREHLERGGAVLLASDRSDGNRMNNYRYRMMPGPVRTLRPTDRYEGYADCPIITDVERDHPVMAGIGELVVNRGGFLLLLPQSQRRNPVPWQSIARYPRVTPSPEGAPASNYFTFDFAAAMETPLGNRMVCVADQSVFSNQMLLLGDNALFANNTLKWLAEDGRTHVLIVSDYSPMQPFNPDRLDVALPPPTAAQLRKALRNLPPEALMEFGNALTQIMEDEGVANELASMIFESMPQHKFNQMLIVLVTILLGIYLTYRWISYGRGAREPRQMFAWLPNLRITPRRAASRDRRRAAETTVGQLILDLTSDTNLAWADLHRRLGVPNQPSETRRIRRQTGWIQRQLKIGRWSGNQLLRLESDLNSLRHLQQAGLLSVGASRPAVGIESVGG